MPINNKTIRDLADIGEDGAALRQAVSVLRTAWNQLKGLYDTELARAQALPEGAGMTSFKASESDGKLDAIIAAMFPRLVDIGATDALAVQKAGWLEIENVGIALIRAGERIPPSSV